MVYYDLNFHTVSSQVPYGRNAKNTVISVVGRIKRQQHEDVNEGYAMADLGAVDRLSRIIFPLAYIAVTAASLIYYHK